MHSFEELIYNRFADSIRSWDTTRHPDIYAISFCYGTSWAEDKEGNEVILQCAVALSYNTLTHCQNQIAQASDAVEAKWNYAFWLQEITDQFPRLLEPADGTIPDESDLALRDAWCASQGFEPDDSDDSGRPEYGEDYEEAIVALYGRVARKLHDDGVLVEKLGRPVPIIIHTLTYDDEGLQATRKANPDGLADEFFQEFISEA